MKYFLIVLMLMLAGSVFAQDSTKVQAQVQKKEQKRDRFIDMDCDGINDHLQMRFRTRTTERNKLRLHNPSEGKMNEVAKRDQNRKGQR